MGQPPDSPTLNPSPERETTDPSVSIETAGFLPFRRRQAAASFCLPISGLDTRGGIS